MGKQVKDSQQQTKLINDSSRSDASTPVKNESSFKKSNPKPSIPSMPEKALINEKNVN